ncbi:hypothetical protein ACXN5S_11365 [Pseudoroseicyclus sp. H15]
MRRHASCLAAVLLALAGCDDAGPDVMADGGASAEAVAFVTRTRIGSDALAPSYSACTAEFGIRYPDGVTPHRRVVTIRDSDASQPFVVNTEIPAFSGAGVTEIGDGTQTWRIYERSISPCDASSDPVQFQIAIGACTEGACPPMEVANPTGAMPINLEVTQ